MNKIKLESGTRNRASAGESGQVNHDIEKAQALLEELKRQKEEKEIQAEQSRKIEKRRAEFVDLRDDVYFKLSEAVPLIDQELLQAKEEITDLEQTKKHFLKQVRIIEKALPDQWSDDEVVTKAEKFQNYLAGLSREHDGFVRSLSGGNKGGVFQELSQLSMSPVSGFSRDMLRGFAFSLPLMVFITIMYFASQG